jgi:predicted ABC-class ATPase|tara:strand:- start:13 stop:234 length:222 start_codon:yes stop_codon:yes gene_type:complete
MMDEDTCVANFMIRGARMQRLIHSDKDAITPFIERMEELFSNHGISIILVMGGVAIIFKRLTVWLPWMSFYHA